MYLPPNRYKCVFAFWDSEACYLNYMPDVQSGTDLYDRLLAARPDRRSIMYCISAMNPSCQPSLRPSSVASYIRRLYPAHILPWPSSFKRCLNSALPVGLHIANSVTSFYHNCYAILISDISFGITPLNFVGSIILLLNCVINDISSRIGVSIHAPSSHYGHDMDLSLHSYPLCLFVILKNDTYLLQKIQEHNW